MAPGWSGTQRLVRRFGASVVRRMALAGQMFDGRRGACRSASSTRWPRPGEALARAEALAADIAKRGPVAVQIVKAMINAAEGEDRDAPIEGLAGALTAMTEDLAEGVAAFREQARAAFRGPIGLGNGALDRTLSPTIPKRVHATRSGERIAATARNRESRKASGNGAGPHPAGE